MDFTKGKRRQYERLMKEKPGFARSRLSEEEEQLLRKQAREAKCEQMKHGHKTNREG
ncbi:hypothetical protein [Paenibacillus darwinianus]|uniref:hypothetical protein n=1 Tax=Paenibacillus darwinianus TaxID=1380763 RepID=UPI000B14408B|nr:hypothetical protein [Paenibacillus darwinianus]